MKFNINDHVRVKLTKRGHILLAKDHAKAFMGTTFQYIPPTEDWEGWSTWQLHDLMQRLGEYCTLGTNLPFEVEIDILE